MLTWEKNDTNVYTTDLTADAPPCRATWWPRMVLTLVQLTGAHVLLSAIDCLEFSRVVCNRPSSYFICNPHNAHLTTPTPLPALHPCWPPMPLSSSPPPVQASSGQEWYYCRSAWHVISLWVRLLFCQMYPTKNGTCIGPLAQSSDVPPVEASGGQEWY